MVVFKNGIRLTHLAFFLCLLLIVNVFVLNVVLEEKKELFSEYLQAVKSTQPMERFSGKGKYANKTVPEITETEVISDRQYFHDKDNKGLAGNESQTGLDALADSPSGLLKEAQSLLEVNRLTASDPATLVEVVMKSLDSDSAEFREDSLDLLKDIHDDSVNIPLLKAMEDEDPDVKEKAMDIMLHFHDPNILPSLEFALTDVDEDIREQALSILEDIPDHRSIDILIEVGMLNDYWSTRDDVKDSLDFITDQYFETYEEAHKWWALNRDSFVFEQ